MTAKPVKNQFKPPNTKTYTAKPLPAEGFVRLPSVLSVLGISKNAFLDGVKSGKYPAGKLLSSRCRVWHVDEIRRLIDVLANTKTKSKRPAHTDKLLDILNKSSFVKDRDGNCIATVLIGSARPEKSGLITLKDHHRNPLGYLTIEYIEAMSDE
jgi:prophage regulatory protein